MVGGSEVSEEATSKAEWPSGVEQTFLGFEQFSGLFPVVGADVSAQVGVSGDPE